MRKLLASALVVLVTGCATVTHGPMQRISVDSEPNAIVRTHECGPGSTKKVRTPGVVLVSRRAERCALTFEAPGYEREVRYLNRTISERTFGNVELGADLCEFSDCSTPSDWFGVTMAALILIGAGVGVDAATGAMFEQQPSDVVVELQPREIRER